MSIDNALEYNRVQMNKNTAQHLYKQEKIQKKVIKSLQIIICNIGYYTGTIKI
jgi:hypothetical protein